MPLISTMPCRAKAKAESKLSRLWACWPVSNPRSTEIVEGTSTGKLCPAFGPTLIVRYWATLPGTRPMPRIGTPDLLPILDVAPICHPSKGTP